MHKLCQLIACALLIGAIAPLSPGESVSAQGLPFAGSGLAATPGNIFPTPNDALKRHIGPTGKPCLNMNGSPRTQVINPHIFEHWVSATNSCGKDIKVRVCYYGTQDCITMDVPPYGRQDSVLGIYPAMGDFRFESKEQF